VEAVGLNHLDLWVRRGVPGHSFPLPIIPGCDIAGRIERLAGPAAGWKAGDPVLVAPGYGCGACEACRSGQDPLCRSYGILGETRDGGCAERVVVPAGNLIPRPANLSVEEAAALPLTLLTAWHMVVGRAALRPGESILIHAAGSGVGVMAVQIARMIGARVFATVGSCEKADKARELGVEEAILYRETDFLGEIRRLTGKRGVDVVIDHTGAENFEKSVRALAKGGRLVTCGATTGPMATIDLRVLFFKSLSLLGSTMGSLGDLTAGMQHVDEGRIRPVVDLVFSMADLPAAHERLEARAAFGKVVVRGFGR
jgi:2-desacetyl-2-hydroxyethyl bacteriochlorophyllide A dehydrogenase